MIFKRMFKLHNINDIVFENKILGIGIRFVPLYKNKMGFQEPVFQRSHQVPEE
jgi:phosphotransferase system IIA component